MNFSEIFIRRPIATFLLTIAIVFAGIMGWMQLPVASLPSVDYPTINVSASLSGASPDTMASSVATPLEREFSTISGVETITSSSGQGSTSIVMQFDIDQDIDAVAQDVQSAISRTQRRLPDEMTTPPSFRKVNPADSPVIIIAVISDSVPLSKLDEYAQTILVPRISRLSGVAQVLVYGSQKFAVRIQLDPDALASRGIGVNELQQAIADANTNTPLGVLNGPKQQLILQSNEQMANAAEFRDLVVAWRDGAPVRLRDVATVIDDVENNRTGAWINGKRSVSLAVQRQPDANTVDVVDAVLELLPSVTEGLPPTVRLETVIDRSTSIRDSIEDVQFTFLLTVFLVVMVIFLFLRRFSATAIPAVTLPISIIGTLGCMHLLGFSLNNISLLGLTLSVGLVVDDAIVMLENIQRHVDDGMSPLEASLKGSKEIGFTILSITISLVAVFIPILLMGGVVGKLFHEFAVVVTIAIGVSALVSLTLTPVMASLWLKPEKLEEEGPIGRAIERGFSATLGLYQRTLDWVLIHSRITLGVMLITVVLTGWLFVLVPKGFFPIEDTGGISISTEAAQDISFAAMREHQIKMAAIVDQDPNVDKMISIVASGGGLGAVNTGRMFISLVPKGDRPNVMEVIQQLRRKLGNEPGIQVFIRPVQTLNLQGRSSKSQYQYTLEGIEQSVLYPFSEKMRERLKEDPIFQDVTSDLQINSPQAFVDVDRDKAAALGLPLETIRSTLYSAYGTRQISTIYTSSSDYAVILEMSPEAQADPSALSRLKVRSNNGTLVPLDAVATVTRTVGPLLINHQSQLPAVTLSFDVAQGYSLGQATDRVKQIEHDLGLPNGVNPTFAGSAQVFQDSLSNQGILLLAAIVVIYIILGILYESFIHPITILSGLPSAAVGGLLTLLVFGQDLSVIAIIGLLMLIGIVKKNAIMMIDFALEAQRKQGMTADEAIRKACLLRFRPIMMTTMAAIVGIFPIAVGHGAAAELRQPLGLVVVGGLLVSQLLTLYITPVLYLWFERLQEKLGAKTKAIIATEP